MIRGPTCNRCRLVFSSFIRSARRSFCRFVARQAFVLPIFCCRHIRKQEPERCQLKSRRRKERRRVIANKSGRPTGDATVEAGPEPGLQLPAPGNALQSQEEEPLAGLGPAAAGFLPDQVALVRSSHRALVPLQILCVPRRFFAPQSESARGNREGAQISRRF
jgi:hypothetical protein